MKFPEQFRWQNAPNGYATKPGDPFGAFRVPAGQAKGRMLAIIAADGDDTGWEHVSVTLPDWNNKSPSWDEMCIVKNLFWDSHECVVQFHPPAENYVNVHSGCLHLWRKAGDPFPMPPKICV